MSGRTFRLRVSLAWLAVVLFSAAAVEGADDPRNILFYGNSFTNGLGSTDSVPNLVRDIAVAADQFEPHIFNAAVNGKDFSWHLQYNTSPIITGITPGQHWDAVVMQNFSTAPTHLGDVAQHRADSVALYQQVANYSPNVVPVPFETWARGPGHSFYTGVDPAFPGGPAEMQEEVRAGYDLAAGDIDAAAGSSSARVAPVGDAWENANWDDLYHTDIYHANNRGTLLSSLVVYSTIYAEPTSTIDLSGVLNHLNLTAADGEFLTGIADTTAALPIVGDMDCDGDVDFDDVDDFVLGLNDPSAFEASMGAPSWVKGDTDGDGDHDFDDIPGLVGLLGDSQGNGAVQRVPAPSTVVLALIGGLVFLEKRLGWLGYEMTLAERTAA